MKACLLVAMACSALVACEALSEEASYSLELKGWSQTIQVGENAQFGLLIHGARRADLTPQTPPVDPALREWSIGADFGTNLEYEPKTPGIKKIGPFEMEFQGHHLKSGSVLLEVTEAWKPTEERYEFRVFPRTVCQGDKITVRFRQQYSTNQFFDGANPAWNSPEPKFWSPRGGRAWRVGDVYYQQSQYWFELTASQVGKMIVTRKDVPELPESIEFKPIEVEVLKPDTTSHPH